MAFWGAASLPGGKNNQLLGPPVPGSNVSSTSRVGGGGRAKIPPGIQSRRDSIARRLEELGGFQNRGGGPGLIGPPDQGGGPGLIGPPDQGGNGSPRYLGPPDQGQFGDGYRTVMQILNGGGLPNSGPFGLGDRASGGAFYGLGSQSGYGFPNFLALLSGLSGGR